MACIYTWPSNKCYWWVFSLGSVVTLPRLWHTDSQPSLVLPFPLHDPVWRQQFEAVRGSNMSISLELHLSHHQELTVLIHSMTQKFIMPNEAATKYPVKWTELDIQDWHFLKHRKSLLGWTRQGWDNRHRRYEKYIQKFGRKTWKNSGQT